MTLFKKIFLTISIILLTFFALFINHIIDNEKEKTLDSLIVKIENNKQFYTPVLSQSLYTFDKIALEIHLKAIYLDEEVYKINFIDFSSKINLMYNSKKSDATDHIKSIIPLYINNKQLGILTIYYTKSTIKNTVKAYTSDILQLSLLFLFLTFGITFYFIKNITKSINTLATVSAQIAEGNLNVPINIKSNDEIGLLAEKFEIMRTSLIERINLIDQQKQKIQTFNEDLQNSNSFLLQSQSIANIGSWEINTKTNKLICSEQLYKIFSIHKQEFRATHNNFLKLIHPRDRKKVNTIHQDSIKNKNSYTIEYKIICGDKITKTVKENCIHIFDENNNIIKTIGTIQDITEMKQKDDLLYQQSRMAAMGEMLENIAHQWRQPLSVISASATGLKVQISYDMINPEEIVNSMDHINNSVQHLSQTIDDFRDFFKSDKQQNTFLIDTLFDKTFNLITSQFKTANISIIKNIEKITLLGLENELIQVLINILNNARDELVKKENQKRLIIIDVVKEDSNVNILIKDNAGGIPKDILNDVFKSHFTTKQNENGTGVGLTMSRIIIEEHMKGSISVDNVQYQYEDKCYDGAQFKITLPLQDENLITQGLNYAI